MSFYVYMDPVKQMNIFYYNFYLYGQWTNHHRVVLTSPLCMLQALLVQWEWKASMTRWDDDQSYGWWLDDLLEVVEPLSCGTCQSLCTGHQQAALVYYQVLEHPTSMTLYTYRPQRKVLCYFSDSIRKHRLAVSLCLFWCTASSPKLWLMGGNSFSVKAIKLGATQNSWEL